MFLAEIYSEAPLKAQGLMHTVKQVSKCGPKLRPLILSPAWPAFSFHKTVFRLWLILNPSKIHNTDWKKKKKL